MTRLKDNGGFTIVELLIAIAIFSAILLIIVYAFLFGVNEFTQAYVSSKTQETARSIEQAITQSFDLTASGGYTVLNPIKNNSSGITTNGFCLGQYRYSFVTGMELNISVNANLAHVFVQDIYPGCNISSSPQDLSGGVTLATGSKELIGQNMRVGYFNINSNTTSNNETYYNIAFNIAYGDDNTLIRTDISGTENTPLYSCPSVFINGKMCAFATINTIAYQRVQ